MPICKKCLQEKEQSEFYKHPQMPSGYLNFCKECKKLYARTNRSKEEDRKRYWSSGKKRLNVIYHGIMSRCYDKNDSRYKNYGGRGIKVLRKNYSDFYHDMIESYIMHWNNNGKLYSRQTSIERIDNNGNYCKENCKRATMKEQAGNRRIENNICYKNYKNRF